MRNLPFKKVIQIEQVCSNLPLDGFVLILTGKERNGGLLVYLDQIPSCSLPAEWQFKELSELRDEDFLTWDGLAVGYDSLNLQYPLLLTLGPNFYPIRYLFTFLNRLDIYQENARKLALWLYRKSSEVDHSDRFLIKLIELLAPSWLEMSHPIGSIGLMLDSYELLPFLIGEKEPKWVTLAEFDNDLESPIFLLTFDEIKQMFPGLMQCPHFIDWRPILWKNEKQNFLIGALDKMAQIFWERIEKHNQAQFHRLAYAFALEKWLAQTDTEHLVAVFPSGDFESFLKTGNAVFIKQMPKIYVGTEYHQEIFTLIDLLNSDQRLQDAIGKAYGGIPFCIEPLSKLMPVVTSLSPCPLEKVLYAVGKAPSLSATFLSLANDFIRYDGIKSTQFSAEQIRNIALKGTYLLALGDPWNKMWRGRFNLLLDQAYAILNDALLYDEKARQSQQSRLLRIWYSLYLEENLSRRWDELRQLERGFVSKDFAQETYILDVFAGNKLLDVKGKQIRDLQYVPISWKETTPTLTRDFLVFYDEWYRAHKNRISIEQNLLHTPPSEKQIEQILSIYRGIQRRLYALPHEAIVLRYLCSEDMDALKNLQDALQKTVVLYVQLRMRRIFTGKVARLLFEIQNIGDKDATDIEMFLDESPHYEIVEGKTSQYISNLPAHTGGHFLEWRIRVHDEGMLKIRLKSNSSKINENEGEQFEFSLEAIRRNEKPQGPRGGNPFQAGVAVDGDKFFGRLKELKSIFEIYLYWTKQPILLHGPRRMGKTSILHQIMYLLKNLGELQRQLGYDNEDEMQLRLIKPVFTTLQGTTNEKEISGWYFDLFTKILETVGLLDLQIDRSAFDSEPHHVFERHIRKILENHPELRLVILVDEWDEERHLPALGGKLRALIQSELPLNWVISSTWMLGEEQNRFPSPFYAQLKVFELKEMTWEEARSMVETLSERVGVTWEDDAMIILLEQTALRPSLIQSLGQRIIEYIASAKSPYNVVEKETVWAVISDFVRGKREQGSQFAFLWEKETTKSAADGAVQARLSWLGRLILLILDDPNQNSSGSLKLMEIRNSLRAKLQEQNVQFSSPDSFNNDIEENLRQLTLIFDVLKIEGERYLFSIPLAQAWFRNAISQYSNPWQFAFESLKKERGLLEHTNKEQKWNL